MNFALLTNLITNYQNKSLLRSSEFHALILAGVAAAAKQWAPHLDPSVSNALPTLVEMGIGYAVLRISGKMASSHTTAPKILDPLTGAQASGPVAAESVATK